MKFSIDTKKISQKIIIYGARSIALGVYYAINELFPEKEILGFLVSSGKDNPSNLAGMPVAEIQSCSKISDSKKNEITVLIGTPETAHNEIKDKLDRFGFHHYICINWKIEEELMEQYYLRKKKFPSLHGLDFSHEGKKMIQNKHKVCVFQVKSDKDVNVKKECQIKTWLHTLQAGASRTDLRIAEYTDDRGENISEKNGNYCELTALYWIWKNVLESEKSNEYFGMFQYRRLLNIEDEDICRIFGHQVDVVLPFPTIHEPDIREHHARYLKDADWHAMLQALQELQPDYARAFQGFLEQPYLYNYNILIAKKEVLRDYCKWLFSILNRIEEISNPKGWEREDRYIGYLGENLLTLYFMYHADKFLIMHTGRKMMV